MILCHDRCRASVIGLQMEVNYFTPGQLRKPGPPLAPYRSATCAGALGPYLDAYTQPGDLVIDLFCHAPTLIVEAVRSGRRALGLNVNRATLLGASLGLTTVERRAVEVAFTRLADARKGPETLQEHIEGMYRTTCAFCGGTAIADVFIWEREGDSPVAKRWRCESCDSRGEAPADEADRNAAASFEARGLSYWLLLDRAAPGDAPYRDRIASLIDLYTPRNLSAVNDLLLKSERLDLSPPVRTVIEAMLLDVLDLATSLRGPDSSPSRPRRLQRPTRYVEANVWRLLEQALEAWCAMTPTPVAHAPNLESLLAQNALSPPSAYLAPLSTGQAARSLPADCAALVVVDPPRPDAVLWHLSALWCHWLWGSQAGAPLTLLLSRRWLDKDWLWRGLCGALKAAVPLLRNDGRLVCLFSDENPVILAALMLAAAGAGYELVGWGAQPPGEVRLAWRAIKPHPRAPELAPVEPDALSRAVAERAAAISLDVLRTRGEPVDWTTLQATIYAGLAEGSLLARAATLGVDVPEPLSWLADAIRAALDGAPLRQYSTPAAEGIKGEATAPLWGLDATLEPEAAPPLSDRVESTVVDVLCDLLAVTEKDLHSRVCARFPGPLTPDPRLIQLCLTSYGDEYSPGHWRLRIEDDTEARAAEIATVVADLTSLGQRLGFEVAPAVPDAGEWAVRWLDEGGHAPFVFAVRTTAVLGDLLFNPPPFAVPQPPSSSVSAFRPNVALQEKIKTTPCLTLPGGRAGLVGYKLRHNPRLRQQMDQAGWRFLKFRHLRHLVQEVAAKQLDRYAFQAALGLDPVVEQGEAQLSLW